MDLDQWEERAAIMEFGGGMTRFQAETLAAQLQGRQRWEFKNEISKRNSQEAQHQRKASERNATNNLPRVQRASAQKD